MPKGLVNESSLNSIAEAINVLNGTEGTYHPSEMAAEILDAIPDVTVEGNPINITDAAAYPAVSCVTTLEPVQEGSGDPSPENVRPITGHTGVELTRTGKNLLVFPYTRMGSNPVVKDGVTYTANSNGSISITGTADFTGSTSGIQLIDIVLPAGQYILSDLIDGVYFHGQKISGDTWKGNIGDSIITGTRIITIDYSNYDRVRMVIGVNKKQEFNTTYYPMLRVASDIDPTYAPYKANTSPVTFPALGKNLLDNNSSKWTQSTIAQNKYNGDTTRFAPTGIELHVKPNQTYTISLTDNTTIGKTFQVAYRQYDPNNTQIAKQDWTALPSIFTANSKADIFRITFRSTDQADTEQFIEELGTNLLIQMEEGSTATTYEPYTNTVYSGELDVLSGVLTVYPEYDSYNGETLTGEWISDRDVYAAGTTPTIGAQVVDLGGTPTTYQLTPEVITLLKGVNNIWTDSGTSKIKYKVDLNSYIQKLIDEASAQASSFSVSPLSLGKSAIEPVLLSTGGEDAGEIEEVDEPVVFDKEKESEPIEEAAVEEPKESDMR